MPDQAARDTGLTIRRQHQVAYPLGQAGTHPPAGPVLPAIACARPGLHTSAPSAPAAKETPLTLAPRAAAGQSAPPGCPPTGGHRNYRPTAPLPVTHKRQSKHIQPGRANHHGGNQQIVLLAQIMGRPPFRQEKHDDAAANHRPKPGDAQVIKPPLTEVEVIQQHELTLGNGLPRLTQSGRPAALLRNTGLTASAAISA
jgi:hypothetical protein